MSYSLFKNGVGGVALVVLESELEEGTSRVALRIKPKNGTGLKIQSIWWQFSVELGNGVFLKDFGALLLKQSHATGNPV